MTRTDVCWVGFVGILDAPIVKRQPHFVCLTCGYLGQTDLEIQMVRQWRKQ